MRSRRHLDSHPSWPPTHRCQQKGGARGLPWRVALGRRGVAGHLQASIAQKPPSKGDFQEAASSVLGRPWCEGPVKGEAQNYL